MKKNYNKISMGIDYGKYIIGIAIGQNLTNTATPLKNIKNNKKNTFINIKKLIIDWNPYILIIGMPSDIKKNFNIINNIKKFSCKLYKISKLPIKYINEDYTSKEANYYKCSKKNIRKDKYAAKIILEDWLNNNNYYI